MTNSPILKEPFHDTGQQRSADLLGMHVFLATEIMLFSGLFAGILFYRVRSPEAVVDASQHLFLWLGGLNTAVLLTSSLTMALAVVAARQQRRSSVVRRLLATAALGLVFLAVKGVEYYLEYHEGLIPGIGPTFDFPSATQELFINLYLIATGLHAVHLTVGIVMAVGFAIRWWLAQERAPEHSTALELVGLYWHLVDVVWVFLYPALYLARG